MRGAVSTLDRAKCGNCGKCAEVCPSKAREVSGRLMNVDDVMGIVLKDRLYYLNSEGGVTFGGGEPTAAGGFLLDLLQASADEGLHTTVDTCGYCPEDRFEKVTALADLFLFDCKHMDPGQHKRLTGRDNALILRNLKTALLSGKEVRIRMPLMPDLNDSEENVAAMAAFFLPFHHAEIEIMPCHTFGHNKYRALGRELPPVRQYSPEELARVRGRFSRHGLSTVIA
jgi:pyruvate formate lyase activating enzyme